MPDRSTTSRTILFADIAGSAQLYDRLGDSRGRQVVAAAIEIMMVAAHANRGRVVKTIGDEVMCSFASPDRAAKAAVRMSEAVCTDRRLVANTVRLRIGFHCGPVIQEAQDMFGDAVNIAARMTAQAKAGQIITSRQTLEQLTAAFQDTARLVDQARVKGKSDLVEIFEIAWGQPDELTLVARGDAACIHYADSGGIRMILELQGQLFCVNGENPVVTIGREKSNQLVIKEPKVSRVHAQLEIRKDTFVLSDKSTNGTYVYPESGKMILVRRDEVRLDGNGYFGVGAITEANSSVAVHYSIDNPRSGAG